ncbi:uncharacterized protein LOC116167737 isoform X2 [Photinus pyralis]|uniref:uncharacterized protein LOC116167737 isoform X2 n=1 Tax=Photinus pyralis TaxID=7054 RepID=UPI001266F9B7|nr:uncharacterized protein LOC116167737 isoform X2 [Photinus pyralis]
MPKTRKDLSCSVFGGPEKLKDNMLPTCAEVIKHYLWVRSDLMWISNGKDPSIKEICAKIATDLSNLWKKASLPIISNQQIISRLIDYYKKYKNLMKCRVTQKKADFYETARKTLFDISVCKCACLDSCKCSTKIPRAEREFLTDQRGDRKMYIGSIDAKSTKVMARKQLRREFEELRQSQSVMKQPSLSSDAISANISSSESDSEHMEESSIDPDFYHSVITPTTSESATNKTNKQMRLRLKNLAAVCDRAGVSDRSGSLIASALLKDLDIISQKDKSKIIDRSKLRRERQKMREDLQKLENPDSPLLGLYFDGRKDKTIIQEERGNKRYRKTITEEHIVLLAEPGSRYIGHVTPISGTASSIKGGILQFLNLHFKDVSSLVAIGCDGTAVNTGSKNGVVALIEKQLHRLLHWFVYGSTSGPNSFIGTIGKQLQSCEGLHVVTFSKIEANLPDIDVNLLSNDQKYLYEVCISITQGLIPPDLANKQPGKLAHSRWLTCANRILRLYVGTAKPSQSLVELAEFVIKVYAPTWFDIKLMPSCRYGPQHILNMIKRCAYLEDDKKAIVFRTIQRNSFFAHSENVLLAMLQDERGHIQELALRRIMKARKTNKGKKVREFITPKLNFEANEYYDLIDWTTEKIYEPPITQKYTDSEILQKITSANFKVTVEEFPCHSQAVERGVKLVTEASSAVCGSKARDGYIRARIKSRTEVPKFDTKSQFFV